MTPDPGSAMNLCSPPGQDLADRLRGPQGPTLMRALQDHLAELQAQLQARAALGADAAGFEQLQPGLRAVQAANDILLQLPVRSGSDPMSALFSTPTVPTRSPS